MSSLTGRRIAALLDKQGMNQRQLAEATNLTPAAISRYISGAREPRAITVAAIAKALRVEPADIIGDEIRRKNR